MIVAGLLAVAGAAEAKDTYTHGHFRRDGTYVPPHYSSAPDGHHSSQPTFNPNAGRLGLMNPNIQPAKPVGSNGTP
jgi:hypothetical protein